MAYNLHSSKPLFPEILKENQQHYILDFGGSSRLSEFGAHFARISETVRWIFTWGETLPPALGSRWAERRRVVELLISGPAFGAAKSVWGRGVWSPVAVFPFGFL